MCRCIGGLKLFGPPPFISTETSPGPRVPYWAGKFKSWINGIEPYQSGASLFIFISTLKNRDVRVYRLVSRGTVEELKYLRQVYKTQLKKDTILNDDDRTVNAEDRRFRGVHGDNGRKGGTKNRKLHRNSSRFLLSHRHLTNRALRNRESHEV